MKRLILILFAALFSHTSEAQRKCGFESVRASLISKDPTWAERLEFQRASLQGIADNYHRRAQSSAKKTTAAYPIPVIFHFILTDSVYLVLGGASGIQQRVDSQVAVMNRDFNRENPDSTLIPTGWKHLYASAGIRFGSAHTTPSGFGTPGYEIRMIPNSPGGFYGYGGGYSDAKHNSSGGLDAWDATKYLNIWVTIFKDYSDILGLTVFKSATGTTGYPLDEEGVVLNFGAIGKRASPSDFYIPTGYFSDYYDGGRTLTHELGHFFEIWHTWGDDGGQCPWQPGGHDDGLADTPPEGNSKINNYPDTIPGGTYYDLCRYDGVTDTQAILYGVATHDYMNYVDDVGMFMFTNDQAAVMASQVAPGGENYSLTQNPDLLNWSVKTAVPDAGVGNSLLIFPNPTTGIVYASLDNTKDVLQKICVSDIFGREVLTMAPLQQKDLYSINLTGMPHGIYFVRCTFAGGSVCRKITLQ